MAVEQRREKDAMVREGTESGGGRERGDRDRANTQELRLWVLVASARSTHACGGTPPVDEVDACARSGDPRAAALMSNTSTQRAVRM